MLDVRVGTVVGQRQARRLRALQPAAPAAEPVRARRDARARQSCSRPPIRVAGATPRCRSGSSSAPRGRWWRSTCARARCSRSSAATKRVGRARSRDAGAPAAGLDVQALRLQLRALRRAASRRRRCSTPARARLTGYRPEQLRRQRRERARCGLREALAHSVNVAAVHVLQDVGPANVVSLGPRARHPVEARRRSVARARLVRGDALRDGRRVRHVRGGRRVRAARARHAHRRARRRRRAAPAAPAVAPRDGRSRGVRDDEPAHVGRRSRHRRGRAQPGAPVAGKTGTSNQAKDAWFVGYSTDIVCATWTGYDDARPLGAREAGATAALPAWIAFMKAAHEKRPATEFPRPPGVVIGAHRSQDRPSRLRRRRATRSTRCSSQGTEPQEISTPDAGATRYGRDGDESTTGAGVRSRRSPKPPAEVTGSAAPRRDGGCPQLPAEDPPPF